MSQRSRTTQTIPLSSLDPDVQRLVREAGAGKVQLAVIEDGQPVAIVLPGGAQAGPTQHRRRGSSFLTGLLIAAGILLVLIVFLIIWTYPANFGSDDAESLSNLSIAWIRSLS